MDAVYHGRQKMCIVMILAAIVSIVNGQCSTSDHPNCASWVKNGFCTNPGYTKAYIQQYCPKACTNSGCAGGSCPTGTLVVGPAVNSACGIGKLVGSMCCATALGPAVGGMCPSGSFLIEGVCAK